MRKSTRVVIISPYPLDQAVWSNFFQRCQGLEVVGVFDGFDAYTRDGKDAVDAVFVAFRSRPSRLNMSKLKGAARIVLYGAVRNGNGSRVTVIPLDATPARLIGALTGAAGRKGKNLELKPPARTYILTDKEVAVLKGVCEGRSLKELAAQGGHSISTVETRLSRIKRKLGATSRSDLILQAAARRLIAGPTGADWVRTMMPLVMSVSCSLV